MNHPEPELFLQALNEMKVRVREANSRRLEFLVLHAFLFCNRMIGLSLPRSSDESNKTAFRYLLGIELRNIFQ